jgi:lipoprotein-anchoring transpeptidase ErfK/SrfK
VSLEPVAYDALTRRLRGEQTRADRRSARAAGAPAPGGDAPTAEVSPGDAVAPAAARPARVLQAAGSRTGKVLAATALTSALTATAISAASPTHRATGDGTPATGPTLSAGVLPDGLPALQPAGAAVDRLLERREQAKAGELTAHLTRTALLRAAPGGARVSRVGLRTGYGAKRVFAVAAVKPGWVGVRALQMKDNSVGWLPASAVRLQPTRTLLVSDLSARTVTLRVGGKVRYRFPIAIGRAGSRTPIGRYGVTDRLKTASNLIYGCCVIPLTGHQQNLPAGWTGGTRIALHGTLESDSVGRDVSAGCMRMHDKDLKRLMGHVPLGTTVIVRA